MKIQALNRSNLDALLVFNESLMKASGRDGNPIYNPFDDTHPWESGRRHDTTIHRWETDVGQLGWGRSFGIIDEDGAIQGETEVFHRYRLSTSLTSRGNYHRSFSRYPQSRLGHKTSNSRH
jgi:hypothetical protein